MLELFQLSFTSLGNFFNYFVVAGCSKLSRFPSYRFRICACFWMCRSKRSILQKRSSKREKAHFFPLLYFRTWCSSNWVRKICPNHTHTKKIAFHANILKWNKSESWISEKKTSSFSNDKTNVNVVIAQKKSCHGEASNNESSPFCAPLSLALFSKFSLWQPRKMIVLCSGCFQPQESSDCTLIDSCWFPRWQEKCS